MNVRDVVAFAPGRVNLIGDHTDYTGGLCMPIAIDAGITITGRRDPQLAAVRLSSKAHDSEAVIPLDVSRPGDVEPAWARYVGGVVSELHPAAGFAGRVDSTLPEGAGLSSSAALEVACALALGADRSDPVALARLCQAAEHAARGVPTGLLDQLASICGVAGHGLLLDCRDLTVTPVPLPGADDVEWLVVHTSSRSLADSGYGDRVRELAKVEERIGPLRDASVTTIADVEDPVLRARARHVVSENERVTEFARVIAAGDAVEAGRLMDDSHASLSGDFDCSTPQIDALCGELRSTRGVLGARMTGGGWGGCVIALARPGALSADDFGAAWFVRPGPGATISA